MSHQELSRTHQQDQSCLLNMHLLTSASSSQTDSEKGIDSITTEIKDVCYKCKDKMEVMLSNFHVNILLVVILLPLLSLAL